MATLVLGAIFVLLVTQACSSVDKAHLEVTEEECLVCHRVDFDNGPHPDHMRCPETCICHGTESWNKAVSGIHPEDSFPRYTGIHGGFRCLDCHNPDLALYAADNIDCIDCHLQVHEREKMVETHASNPDFPTDDASNDFCLECHPDGLKPKE